MWVSPRRAHPSPESETALRAAEKSLQDAQERMPEAQARLVESRRVKEQLQAHNLVSYSAVAQALVFGQRPTAAS
ncbi:hypothetical protein ACFV3E_05770 [Streptomyces sp. NPDC059718]